MDEIHASTINANCALTTTKHTKTVIMDFIKKVIILFLHLQKQVTDKKHEHKRADASARFFNDYFLFILSFLFLADLTKKIRNRSGFGFFLIVLLVHQQMLLHKEEDLADGGLK